MAVGWFHCKVSSIHIAQTVASPTQIRPRISWHLRFISQHACLLDSWMSSQQSYSLNSVTFMNGMYLYVVSLPHSGLRQFSSTTPSMWWSKLCHLALVYRFQSLLIADWFPYYLLYLISIVYGKLTHRGNYIHQPLMHLMQYYPAVDMEMRIERTANFITMVLGYIVVNLLYQSSALFGLNV